MRKILLTLSLALMMTLGLACAVAPVNAQAATLKLNATSKTVKAGSTFTLKVSGTGSKVKWGSSNKSVATVTQAGKVTAKAAGKASIAAKVDGKKLVCKVTVKKGFDAKAAKKAIEDNAQILRQNNCVVVLAKNTYEYPVYCQTQMTFYNDDGSVAGTWHESAEAIYTNGEFVMKYWNIGSFDYLNGKVKFEVTSISECPKKLCPLKYFDFDVEQTEYSVEGRVYNREYKDIYQLRCMVVFYDENNKAVGADLNAKMFLGNDDKSYFDLYFNIPEAENFEKIKFDHYKVKAVQAFYN